jgi:ribosomal protein S18 acetylase RimI-like enzyme
VKNITSRCCDYQKEQKRLINFWLDYRTASDVRAYPTIWRIRLLLTSRVWEPEKDARIWEDASGQITGFAMLWRRQPTLPYIVLDVFSHPAFADKGIFLEMLKWGTLRAHEIATEQKMPLTIYANGFSRYNFTDSLLQQSGYTALPPNPDEHNVYFARSLQNEILIPSLPPGYSLRALQESDDLESYQSLYGFAKVSPLHQKELIESDEYRHLIIVNPAGEFVAYCECSICRAEWQITNQRIGWIDYIETRAGQQKIGLGHAILSAGLSQLQEWGADLAMLITVSTNTPAVNLYKKTGFECVEVLEYPAYQKQIECSNEK